MSAINLSQYLDAQQQHWDKMYAEELDFLAKSIFMQVKRPIEEVIT